MSYITIFISCSLHKFVSWDIFLRSVTFFIWWNWITISVYEWCSCLNYFTVNVSYITILISCSLNKLISWDIFLRLVTFFIWWNWVTISIYEWCSCLNYFTVNMSYVTIFISCSLNKLVAWDIFLRLVTLNCWIIWNRDFFTIWINCHIRRCNLRIVNWCILTRISW